MFEVFCRGKVPLLSLLLQSLDQSVIIEVHHRTIRCRQGQVYIRSYVHVKVKCT